MCEICDGKTEDEARLDFARKIDTYGWAIQAVEVSPDNPPWAYTVGLVERFGHPELVVTSLPLDECAGLLNELAVGIGEGRRLSPGASANVGGVPVQFADVHPAQFGHGVFNRWFDHYRARGPDGPRLTALQVLLPAWLFCGSHARRVPRLDLPEPALGVATLNRAARRARQRGQTRGGRYRGRRGPGR
jgi:hypothetical protein